MAANRAALFDEGIAYLERSNYPEALELFNQILVENPEFLDAYYQRAYTLNRMGRHKEAITDLKNLIEQDEDYIDAYYERALAYSSLQNYHSAIDDFNEFLERDPENYQVRYARAQAYIAAKKLGRASADLTWLLENGPDDPKLHLLRGQIYYNQNITDRAIYDFTVALEIDPAMTDANLQRAVALESAGDMDTALTDYIVAVQVNPNVKNLLSLAIAYLRRQQYELALEFFEMAINKDPHGPGAWQGIPQVANMGYYRHMLHHSSNLCAGNRSNGLDFNRLADKITGSLMVFGLAMPLLTLPVQNMVILNKEIADFLSVPETGGTGTFYHAASGTTINIEFVKQDDSQGPVKFSLNFNYDT